LIGLPFRVPNAFRYNFATWAQVLERDVRDPAARCVLSQYWGYFGLPPSKVSFLYFATGLASYLKYGAAFPRGRSQALSNALLAVVEESGGEVRMGCGAKRITVSGGRVTGVVTDEEHSVQADFVVSNADPVTTCRELIGEEHVPSEFFDRLRSNRVAASTLNCYLGVACPVEELGLTEHEIFVNTDYDFEGHGRAMERLDAVPSMAMTCYNVVMPEISPPGTSMVVLTVLGYGDPWLKLPPEQYVDTKNRIAEGMLDLAERVCPGLRDRIEVIEVSTPITNMRYAGNLGGSIYGFENVPGENTVWRIPNKGPVGGLYFAGAWTRPGGGFEPSIISGRMAGGEIARKLMSRREKRNGL